MYPWNFVPVVLNTTIPAAGVAIAASLAALSAYTLSWTGPSTSNVPAGPVGFSLLIPILPK